MQKLGTSKGKFEEASATVHSSPRDGPHMQINDLICLFLSRMVHLYIQINRFSYISKVYDSQGLLTRQGISLRLHFITASIVLDIVYGRPLSTLFCSTDLRLTLS